MVCSRISVIILPAKHAKGEMRKIFDWDTNKYHGEIPEAAETYNVIGNINEWQVTIGETTYGGREEMVGFYRYHGLWFTHLCGSSSAVRRHARLSR